MVSPRGGVFEGEKYLLQAETLLTQLESQKIEERVRLRNYVIIVT